MQLLLSGEYVNPSYNGVRCGHIADPCFYSQGTIDSCYFRSCICTFWANLSWNLRQRQRSLHFILPSMSTRDITILHFCFSPFNCACLTGILGICYVFTFQGLSFAFPIPSQYTDCCHDREGILSTFCHCVFLQTFQGRIG